MRLLNKFNILIIILIVTLSANNLQWAGNQWEDIVEADGKGYYAYLPAVFIYHDLNFSFFDSIEKKHPNPAIYYDYRVDYKGKMVNKYFSGTALAMSPFFLIAHFSASIFGFESDGYSKIYLVMISVGAIFYLWLGLFYLKKMLKCYTKNDTLVSILLIVAVFSTNLFYYTVSEPAMSHIYSFAFITSFVYYSKTFFENPRAKSILVLSFLLGLIILIRPANGIIILALPFLSSDWRQLKRGTLYFFEKKTLVICSLFLIISIVSIQLIIYKIQTGDFFVDAYGAEKFNWLSAHPIEFLFSYKKGLFVYTPILLLSMLGFIQLFKSNRFQFYSLISFLGILIYVLSAWWNWWYGGSFGTRVMIEYYSIFFILLLVAIQAVKKKMLTTVFYSLLICSMLVCQIQTYQYRYYHIHWEKMDNAHYWRAFLRMDLLIKNINPNKDLLETN